jgi:hypothetical protein
MATLNLDLTNVQPATGVQDPVPAGWYKMAMTASELKPTKDGSGQRLACEFTILEGQYQGRKVFEGFNLVNQNQDAVRIAYEQLAAIGTAVGILQIGQSEQLHNIPMDIKVKLTAAQMEMPPAGSPPGAAPTEKYAAKNEITAYRRAGMGGGAPAAAAPAFAPPPQAPAAPAAPAAAAPAPAWTPPAAAQPWAPPAGAAAPAAPAYAPAQAAPAPAAMQPPAAPTAPAVTGLPVAPPWMQQPGAPAA